MKSTLSAILVLFFVAHIPTAEAQMLKRIKNKLENKVSQEIEKEAEKTIDKITTPKTKQTKDPDTQADTDVQGVATIKHSKVYGNMIIDAFGKTTVERQGTQVEIYGSWTTHSAAKDDGFALVIPNGDAILFNDNQPIRERVVLQIPEDARFALSYDASGKAATSDNPDETDQTSLHYQSFAMDAGEIVIDVLSESNLQISFNGRAHLRLQAEQMDSDRTPGDMQISGAIDLGPVAIVDAPIEAIRADQVSKPDQYTFTFQTEVHVTDLDENKTYPLFYLMNPQSSYLGIKANLSDFSDEPMEGESIMVMDDGKVHIFVETQGMKMRMSPSAMAGQGMQNPTEQMSQYDYASINKTGNTKIILGATCHEYTLSNEDVTIQLWAAPDINLPNWFAQENTVIEGHIMEYEVRSEDGHMKSETIAIEDHIEKTIDPKMYRKMF